MTNRTEHLFFVGLTYGSCNSVSGFAKCGVKCAPNSLHVDRHVYSLNMYRFCFVGSDKYQRGGWCKIRRSALCRLMIFWADFYLMIAFVA